MANTPRAALGTLLKVGNAASPEVFNTVALVGNITGPGLKRDTADVSNHTQPDLYKQFVGTLKEGGDIKFVLFFDPQDVTQNQTTPAGAASPGLLYLFEQGLPVNFQLVLPATISPTIKWSFVGLVIGFENKYDVNGALMADCTIKISGKPTLA